MPPAAIAAATLFRNNSRSFNCVWPYVIDLSPIDKATVRVPATRLAIAVSIAANRVASYATVLLLKNSSSYELWEQNII